MRWSSAGRRLPFFFRLRAGGFLVLVEGEQQAQPLLEPCLVAVVRRRVPQEAGDERFIDHVIDDAPRGVVGAGGLARRLLRLRVVGGQQVLEDAPQQLGVESDFEVERRILLHGELVAAEQGEQAVFGSEEQACRNIQFPVVSRVVGEGVDAPPAGPFPLEIVEALEQAAVDEGHGAQLVEKTVGVGQQGAAAVEGKVAVVVGVDLAEAALVDRGVQRGEEQVLQHGAVVAAFGRVAAFQRGAGEAFLEKIGGNEAFFLEEPDEQQAGNQADDVPLAAARPGAVVGEAALLDRPLEPAEQFAVEAPVQLLDVERSLPGDVQLVEVVNVRFPHARQRELAEDFEVRAVRVGEADVLDQGDLFEHVLLGGALVCAAVDDGQGQRCAVPVEDENRHMHEAVDGAGHVGQARAGVGVLGEFDGQEEKRVVAAAFERSGLQGRHLPGLLGDFVGGDLEDDIDAAPGVEQGALLGGQSSFGVEILEQFGGAADGRGALAAVAERFEHSRGAGAQRAAVELGQSLLQGFKHRWQGVSRAGRGSVRIVADRERRNGALGFAVCMDTKRDIYCVANRVSVS